MPAMPTTVVASKRTTPPKPRSIAKIDDEYDIDALLAAEDATPLSMYDPVDMIPTTSVHIFGEDFRILKGINILVLGEAMSADEDETPNITFFFDYFHPDDIKRFKAAYARQRVLSGKALNVIVATILKAAADPNPTGPASGSGRTAGRRTSRQLSAGN